MVTAYISPFEDDTSLSVLVASVIYMVDSFTNKPEEKLISYPATLLAALSLWLCILNQVEQ